MYFGYCDYWHADISRRRVTYTSAGTFACEHHTMCMTLVPIDARSGQRYPTSLSPFSLTEPIDEGYAVYCHRVAPAD